jgi:2-polyprenyl-6-methoxyphenol hydroxylase-like FAD-dependent oxidoreductase
MVKVQKALVIGGGVAGPVTALALGRAGIEATVFEAYDGPAVGAGGSLMLAPNGLAAARLVGVDAALQAVGLPVRVQEFGHGTGKRFGRVGVLSGLEPSLLVPRGELCRVLAEAAVSSGVKMEYGKRLVAVQERPGSIVAKFEDGTAAEGDVLIGADGIHSAVRTLIDPSAPGPQHAGLISFGAPAPASTSPAWVRGDEMYFVMGKRAFFGYFQQPDGRMNWFSNLPYDRPLTGPEARAVPKDQWWAQLKEAYAGDIPADAMVTATNPDDLLVLGSMEAMPPVPHWFRDRMVLVGDSVHAPSSSSGQGASLTLESAIQIARCLRDLPDLPTAFAAYEALRRKRVEEIAATALKTNAQKSGGPVKRGLIRVLAPLFMKTFLTPEKMFGPVHRYRVDWDEKVA